MKFDAKAPDGGLEIDTVIENGKVYLDCKIHLEDTTLPPTNGDRLELRIWDREGRLIFCCRYPLAEEESLKGIILHPHLWQGIEDAYLYRVRAVLMKQGDLVTDELERALPLRNLYEIPMKGWFLNGKSFEMRRVLYETPFKESGEDLLNKEWKETRIREDLAKIKELGANGICSVGFVRMEEMWRLSELCDEMGLIHFPIQTVEEGEKNKLPTFYGTPDSLLSPGQRACTDRYYYYKACWSKEPFVHISLDSITFTENGNARTIVYSNQKKVALYVDGVLYEFRNQGPDFIFEEIPVKQRPFMLTAETGECSMSVTVYPMHKI